MKLLANENLPGLLIKALRGEGHDVTWIREFAPGMKDPQVLQTAVREDRILVTFDKDFGELAFRDGKSHVSGIILLRLPLNSPEEVTRRTLSALNSRNDFDAQLHRGRTKSNQDDTAPPMREMIGHDSCVFDLYSQIIYSSYLYLQVGNTGYGGSTRRQLPTSYRAPRGGLFRNARNGTPHTAGRELPSVGLRGYR